MHFGVWGRDCLQVQESKTYKRRFVRGEQLEKTGIMENF